MSYKFKFSGDFSRKFLVSDRIFDSILHEASFQTLTVQSPPIWGKFEAIFDGLGALQRAYKTLANRLKSTIQMSCKFQFSGDFSRKFRVLDRIFDSILHVASIQTLTVRSPPIWGKFEAIFDGLGAFQIAYKMLANILK